MSFCVVTPQTSLCTWVWDNGLRKPFFFLNYTGFKYVLTKLATLNQVSFLSHVDHFSVETNIKLFI